MKNNVILFSSGLVVLLIILNSCKKEEVPTLTTTTVTNITETTAISGGTITDEGYGTVIQRGVCWSKGNNPTTADNKTSDGAGTGSFTSSLTQLTPNTKYYLRAYAVNSVGTAYGDVISFTTEQIKTITDIDGNVYKTVKIGTQEWMAENLKTTKYRNGDLIGTTTPLTLNIYDETSPKYQWPCGGDESNVTTYGRLYTWYAVTDSRDVCPTGWHVPNHTEWTTLTTYLGGKDVAGGKLKEAGTTHWWSPNRGATNETGFTALPGNFRGSLGGFATLGWAGSWWSYTKVTNTSIGGRGMSYQSSSLDVVETSENNGHAVRCLKD